MLKYNGFGFLANVPARDLTEGEVDIYGGEEYLISTGVYRLPTEEELKATRKKPQKKKEVKVEETAKVAEELSAKEEGSKKGPPKQEGE